MTYFVDDNKQADRKTQTAKVSSFIRFIEGIPVRVQILGERPVTKWQHWIKTSDGKDVAIKCAGFDDCPICVRNKELGSDEHPDYIKLQKRFMDNVLDLTLSKKSPTGQVFLGVEDEEGNLLFPEVDDEGNDLTKIEPAPLNEVRILEQGVTLFRDKLNPLDVSVRGPDNKRLGIRNFVVELRASGSGRKRIITAVSLNGVVKAANPDDYKDQLHDLNAGFTFEPDEIKAMLDGVPLSDILSARAAQEEVEKAVISEE